MFKYFRRQRSRLSLDDNISIDQTSQDSNDGKRNSLRSVWSFGDERIASEDNSCAKDAISLSTCDSITSEQWNENDDIFTYQSRLSMSMSAVVNNRNCLSYFVQYLETKNCLPLIKFYLDSEHFKTAAINQLDLEQKYQSTSSLKMELTANKEDIKHNVPELKSLCDLSMRKPLTDDEKSQIYAETTEKISQCCASKTFTTTIRDSSAQDLRMENVTASKECISAASITDALAIYEKYLIDKSEQYISIPVSILSQISLILCKNELMYDDGGKRKQLMVPTNCFDEAQQYILQRLEDDHLPEFLHSVFYCKYCVELIENISKGVEVKLTIYDILYSEMALFFFMEFLEQQHDRNYLDFWTAAINFRRSYLNSEALFHFKESEAQADAMIIYEKYFSLQSSHQLDVLNKFRCTVEESICAKGNIGQCFDLPLQATADYLKENHLDEFLQSRLFENYLHELKFKSNERRSSLRRRPTFRKTAAEKKARHRKTLSDCSNETFNHLSQLNFNHNRDLLPPPPPPPPILSSPSSPQPPLSTSPSGGNNFETFLRTPIMATTNLGIDTHQFINRSASNSHHEPAEGRLRFGHINALGRYEREFETFDTLPHGPKSNWSLTASGNKIKSAMRKLVNLPEDNMQEEIAWQVAEMIVKDVTNVTKIKFRENA